VKALSGDETAVRPCREPSGSGDMGPSGDAVGQADLTDEL
jgi:hypothetical protein